MQGKIFLVVEYIRELMSYDIQDQILEGLVKSLHPTREEITRKQPGLTGKTFFYIIVSCAD